MDTGVSYANIGGALMYFPLLAIVSVPLAVTTINYCLLGIRFTEGNRKNAYKALLWVVIGLNVVFIPAVINWQWLNQATAYDGAYHMIGYFGNILLAMVGGVMIGSDHLKSSFIFMKTTAVCFAYLLVGALIGSLMGASTDNPQANLTVLLGIGYASLQLIIPFYYYKRIIGNRNEIKGQLPVVDFRSAPPSPTVTPVDTAAQNTPAEQTDPAPDANPPNRV
jgi:hypothetical protein